ncbi:hypothetical protein AMTRI_Chr03g51880 [Amborella trichopoda]
MKILFSFHSPLYFFFHYLSVSTLTYSNIFPISKIQDLLNRRFKRRVLFFKLIEELVTMRKTLLINRSWCGSNMFFTL